MKTKYITQDRQSRYSRKFKTSVIRGSDGKVLATYEDAVLRGKWDEGNEPPALQTFGGQHWNPTDDDGTLYATGCTGLSFNATGFYCGECYDCIQGDNGHPIEVTADSEEGV